MTITMIVIGVLLFVVGIALVGFLVVRSSDEINLPQDEIDADVGWPNDGDV